MEIGAGLPKIKSAIGNETGRARFDGGRLEEAMLRFIGCVVLIVLLLGLLMVFGVLKTIF